MKIQRTFQHRSARVIAFSRAVLAFFFTLATLADPGAESGAYAGPATFTLLLFFTFYSLAVLAAVWNSWWREAKLTTATQVTDLLVFAILVFLTEGYASPFFTFFVFLVLAAAIRSGWRAAIVTTAVVILIYVAAGASASFLGAEAFEVRRFVVRGSHLVVLSFMIVWFGVNQGGFGGGTSDDALEGAPGEPPVVSAMEHAASRLRGDLVLFVWSEPEEPWVNVWCWRQGKVEKGRHGPETFEELVSPDTPLGPFLFDRRARRVLSASGEARPSAPINRGLGDQYELVAGVAIPIAGGGYEGWMFVSGLPSACSDDLKIAAQVGKTTSLAFERYALFNAYQEMAASRSRLLLARDLHDSLVQFLAGLSLKLQSLRTVHADGGPLSEALQDLQTGVAQEQRDLRRLLGALRQPAVAAGSVSLKEQLLLLGNRLEQQWGVKCDIEVDPGEASVHRGVFREVDLLVREAVANAARHGRAKAVRLQVAMDNGSLALEVVDNGSGFPFGGSLGDEELRETGSGPRSLVERVHALGGTVELQSLPGHGARIRMRLPAGATE